MFRSSLSRLVAVMVFMLSVLGIVIYVHSGYEEAFDAIVAVLFTMAFSVAAALWVVKGD